MSIGFFTPVHDRQNFSCKKQYTEAADDYLYLGSSIAVIVPGAIELESQGVKLEKVNTTCWKTSLKVLSYFTVILPLIAFTLKCVDRSLHEYHLHVFDTHPFTHPIKKICDKAPLILVRTDEPSDLKISVHYNDRFTPKEPIIPKESYISNSSIYTWDVSVTPGGIMQHNARRINMIWWEAFRKDTWTALDTAKAACVERKALDSFLTSVLMKKGMTFEECKAFSRYWSELFTKDYSPESAPYLLVELIEQSHLTHYLPDIHIEGDRASLFKLNRFYFRFEPVSTQIHGIIPTSYLASLEQCSLEAKTVIDVGGELARTPIKSTMTMKDEDTFNNNFANTYIFA